MRQAQILLVLILMMVFVAACGLSEAQMAQTEEAISGTIMAEGTRTGAVRQTEAVLTEVYEAELAETAQAAAATQASGATATADWATRQFNTENTLAARTQEAIAQATEEVSEIYEVVNTLYDLGYITKKAGSHQQLPAFDEDWAQIGWYYISPIPDSYAEDFVLLVDVSWESAHKSAEIKLSGCGVAFRVSDEGDEYYNFMLTLDGNMSFFAKLKNVSPYLSKAYWGKLDYMKDSTTFIITAQGNTYQIFNEDYELIDLRNGSKLLGGTMAYQLSSGGNFGFGTRCNFTDVDLWRLDE